MWGILSLLVGQYLGVVAFVALQSGAFIVGTWLALGLSTGEWTAWYLMSLPILLLHFSVFFALSAWLAVRTRSTTICLVGSLSFWLVCWLVNHGWHAAHAHPAAEGSFGLSAAYWLLPKPADFNWLLFELLHAERYFGRSIDYPALRLSDGIPVIASILTSLLFAAALIASSARRFAHTDY